MDSQVHHADQVGTMLPAALRVVHGQAIAELIPGFIAALPEHILQQRFAAHHDRTSATRSLLALLDSPSPSRSYMALLADGRPVAHLHLASQGLVGEAGWHLLEVAWVAAVIGQGYGRQLLDLVRGQLGASVLCSFTDTANPGLMKLSRASFSLVYSSRVVGLANLPAALLQQQPVERVRDKLRAQRVSAAALHLATPCHVAENSPWQPVDPGYLQRLWQGCRGDWRQVEDRLVRRTAEHLKRLDLPNCAKVLPEAYRAVYARNLDVQRYREVALLQRQRILQALVKDGLLH